MKIQQIQKALEIARSALSDAKNRSANENRALQSKASESIDLFGKSAVSQVAEIARDTRALCEKLYAACQTQIKMLDETCRPLLTDDMPVELIREIWQTIHLLNEESEISVDFTASLNSQSVGDIAAINYRPSMDCQMIESYWETKYKNWSGREELERAEKLEREKKKSDAQKAAAKRKESDADRYNCELEKWEKDAAVANEKREKALTELIEKEREKITKQIDSEFEEEKTKHTQIKEQCISEREETEKALAEAPFYSIIKKNKFKRRIQELSAKIESAEKSIEEAKKHRTSQKRKVKKILDGRMDELQAKLKKKYPIPRKPRKPLSMRVNNPSPMQMATEALKVDILKTLEKCGRLSREELMNKCKSLDDLTEKRVVDFTRALEREGEIIITEERIDEFPYVCIYYEIIRL